MSPRPIPPPEPESCLQQALRMARVGQFAQALAWVQHELGTPDGVETRTQVTSTLGEIARLAEAAGDPEWALRALERATALSPGWADLHLRRSRLLAQRGHRPEARAAVERALKLNPRYTAAAVERALLDARDGRLGEAMEALRALAAAGSLTEPDTFARGIERLGEAEFEEATALLRRALDGRDPLLDEQLRTYHECLERGDGASALAALRAAADLHPEYADLQGLLGASELQAGLYDDAMESLTRALRRQPDYHAARVHLARVLDALGERAEALAQVERVIAVAPGHSGALDLRAAWTATRRGNRQTSSARGKVA